MKNYIATSGFARAVGVASVLLPALAFAAEKESPREARPVSVPMEVATEGLSPAELAEISSQLAGVLEQQRPEGAADSKVRIQLTQEQINSIEFPQPVNGEPLRVGLVVPMTTNVQLQGFTSRTESPGPGPFGGGTLAATPDGGYVWSVAIESDRAGAIRLHVEDLVLPKNAELYFYSRRSGEAYGPFLGVGPDGTGEFWTPSVFGSEGILQLRVHAPADMQQISLRVTEVGHISRGVFGLPGDAEGGVASFCPSNADCIENTNCGSHSVTNNAELAVAKMLWVAGAFINTCSGGLIADNVPSTQIPYFLTANHCISKSSSNLEAFFQYQDSCGSTDNCTGTWDDPPPGSFAGKTVGATLKASNRKGDFTLFQLNQNPPAGSVFLGWTNAPVANSNGVPLYRISHPSGSPQSYSDQTVSTSAPTCQGWPRGERIYSRGVNGAIEGGSSGAPVINGSGQIVGQLTGSCGFNLDDVCDHASNATVDGAFAYYYNKVQQFLNP